MAKAERGTNAAGHVSPKAVCSAVGSAVWTKVGGWHGRAERGTREARHACAKAAPCTGKNPNPFCYGFSFFPMAPTRCSRPATGPSPVVGCPRIATYNPCGGWGTRLQEVLATLRKQPFEPGRVHLSNGQSYVVCHPESTGLPRTGLYVGVSSGKDEMP